MKQIKEQEIPLQINLNKLEKATKIYEEIKKLDYQITELDKFAMLVANGETASSFDLKIVDTGKKNEEENKVGFDEDGSILSIKSSMEDYLRRSIGLFSPLDILAGCHVSSSKDKNAHLLKTELSENATLQILGVLLYEKQSKRQALIDDLKKLGVNI